MDENLRFHGENTDGLDGNHLPKWTKTHLLELYGSQVLHIYKIAPFVERRQIVSRGNRAEHVCRRRHQSYVPSSWATNTNMHPVAQTTFVPTRHYQSLGHCCRY